MSAEVIARAGGPVAAAGLALLVLAAPRPARLAGLVLWAVGLGLFLPELVPAGNGARLALGALVGGIAAVALGALLRRRPWLLVFLTLAAVPVRVPVTVGKISADLLLPLYLVVAAAAVATAWSLARDDRPPRELGALGLPLAALVGWIGLSITWTSDVRQGSIELFFFVLPFSMLAAAVARLPWRPRPVVGLYGLLSGMALLFAGVGIWQWLVRDIFWNPKVIVANAYAPFYRVNSLFWDPSVYGRFLVVAILASLVVLLFRARRPVWEVGAAVVVLGAWTGLVFSFSQSSFVALVVGTCVAAAIAWRWRAVMAVGMLAAVMVPLGIAAPQLENVRDSVFGSSGSALNRATGGRERLVENGLEIYFHHAAVGVGVGAFRHAYAEREHLDKTAPPKAASHNTPVTVASENGTVGLVLFLWLVVAALVVSFRGIGDGRGLEAKTRIVVGLGIAAIFVHSQFYNAFLEDPMVWSLLALAVVASAAHRSAPQGGGP